MQPAAAKGSEQPQQPFKHAIHPPSIHALSVGTYLHISLVNGEPHLTRKLCVHWMVVDEDLRILIPSLRPPAQFGLLHVQSCPVGR